MSRRVQSAMAEGLVASDRVIPGAETSATDGQIVFQPVKAFWVLGHGVAGCFGILLFPAFDALVVFLVLTAVTICVGHSVGMHRMLIHNSFKTHRVVRYVMVWLGTLVGMAGPFGMINAHDMRDWHQRQAICPPHPAHGAGFWRDAYWQLMCTYRLRRPPKLVIEPPVLHDRFYTFVERTWMAQQIPAAILLFWFGGWAWVLWGCSLRVFVSLVGHWAVGHFAHRDGQMGWRIEGLPVQGYNLPRLGLVTFGENWHGNHHAFPYSAQLGVKPGELDPGYVLICAMERFGLAWDVQRPGMQADRAGLTPV